MRLVLACLILSVAAEAATINTTLNITNATLAIGASTTLSGPCTLSGIGSCMFSATVSTSESGFSGPFTITISSTDTITGTFNLPTTVLAGSGSGSATITGGTGNYANATGSFPNLAGSVSQSGTSFTVSLSGAGTITTGGPPSPVISAVLDAASYMPGVALGSVFVIKGTNMSASGLTETTFPLPTNFGGVTITFTPAGGGSGTNAPIIYLYNESGVNQLAAVVPSTLSPGNYNVTVTSNGVTGPAFQTSVVQQKAAIITQDSTGNGLAVIQNYVSSTDLTVNRYTVGSVGGTSIAPATPGQTEILWVVGMGPVPGGGDTTGSPVYDFTQHGVTVVVNVGGTNITPFYGGRAPGLVGVDQINFTLPSNITTGCTVPITITVNGVQSQPTTFMSIATDPTQNACVQPGFTTSQLQAFDQGQILYSGGFNMIQFAENNQSLGGNVKSDEASGSFVKYTGFELPSIPPTAFGAIANGTCIVSQITTGSSSFLAAGGVNLDAGKVTLTGPSGSNINNAAFTETLNTYILSIGIEGSQTQLPGSINGTIVAGTYSLAGAGGKDVGAFNASITLATPLTITGGLPTTTVRASGLPLAWTGGNPSDLVEIFGSSSTTNSAGSTSGVSFVCFTTAGTGGFTVPASILDQLPAVSAAQEANNTAIGFLGVASGLYGTSGNGNFTWTTVSDGASHPGFFTALIGSATTEVWQ